MLRHVEPDKSMAFHDWAEKKELLPLMDYFKTDAAEAEVLTGLTDRVEAAKMLHDWGAKEVVITHNTEVLAYDGNKVYTCPIKARNLSGRTGRGDTTFAGYIAERQRDSVEEALNFCTALVSLKMETPGPFKGTRECSGRAGFFLSVVGGAVYRVSGSTEISMSISKARFHGKW